MFSKTLIIASVATLAVAQSSTACPGQNILDACKATIQAQVNNCAYTDYSCLCTAYTNMVGCYASSGCSNDLTVGTAQQQKELNCNNASVYGSTTILGTATATSAATTASSASSRATSAASGFASGTSSASSSSASASQSSSSNGAGSVGAAGSLLAIVAAGIAALL
ncbi:hypothetical protein LTS08_005244 [Lithohypha guttulata]|nr:hypothetical protein LTS08_005244 [Lithohypha guttulata]